MEYEGLVMRGDELVKCVQIQKRIEKWFEEKP